MAVESRQELLSATAEANKLFNLIGSEVSKRIDARHDELDLLEIEKVVPLGINEKVLLELKLDRYICICHWMPWHYCYPWKPIWCWWWHKHYPDHHHHHYHWWWHRCHYYT